MCYELAYNNYLISGWAHQHQNVWPWKVPWIREIIDCWFNLSNQKLLSLVPIVKSAHTISIIFQKILALQIVIQIFLINYNKYLIIGWAHQRQNVWPWKVSLIREIIDRWLNLRNQTLLPSVQIVNSANTINRIF